MDKKEKLVEELFNIIVDRDTPTGSPMAIKIADFILAREETLDERLSVGWENVVRGNKLAAIEMHRCFSFCNENNKKLRIKLQTAVEALENILRDKNCTCICTYGIAREALAAIKKES